jgi:hypothetical protein
MATFAGEALGAGEMASWTQFLQAITQILLQCHDHTLLIIQVCLLPPVVNAIVTLLQHCSKNDKILATENRISLTICKQPGKVSQ